MSWLEIMGTSFAPQNWERKFHGLLMETSCHSKTTTALPWTIVREDLGLQTHGRGPHVHPQMSGNLQKKGAILCLVFHIAKKCAFRVSRWMASRMFIALFWFYDVLSVRHLLRNQCNFAQKNHSLRVSVTGLPQDWPKWFVSF